MSVHAASGNGVHPRNWIRRLASAALVGALGLSVVAIKTPVRADAEGTPDKITWTTRADFEGNGSTTGEPTFRTGISTAVEPGSVRLGDSKSTASAGYYHTVRRSNDGRAVAVGNNDYGQLNVSGWTDLAAVDAGALHTVGLKYNGTAVATGLNDDGQCDVGSWSDLVAIAAADYHTVGLKENGSVVAVGATSGFNAQGQLNVSGWTDIIAVSAGRLHTVGLKSDGTVVAVGNNDGGRCDVGSWTNIKAISAGEYGTVGLKTDGTVVAVGYNGAGQFDVSGWTDIIAIAAGSTHTIGLKTDGSVVAAGSNTFGECAVTGWDDVVSISAGGQHSAGIRADGTFVSAGSNEYGQRTLPADFVGVWAGSSNTLGLKSDGTATALGSNGDGKNDVTGWTDIVALDSGNRSTVGVKRDGTVLLAGYDSFGQVDVSGWTDIVAASVGPFGEVIGLRRDGTAVVDGVNSEYVADVATWTDLVAVTIGGNSIVGLKHDGTVVATGDLGYGPIDVSSWSDIVAVDANEYHLVGVKADGTVVATGLNDYGELDVSGWTDIVAISTGMTHTVGLKSDGTAVAVGYPYLGHLEVGGWSNLVGIAAGYQHTVGLKADGSVVAIGINSSGETATSGWTSALNVTPRTGTIGGNTKTGLRADGGAGLSQWNALKADVRPLAPGEAVKVGVRVSDDGVTWSDPIGRDGQPINWTSGLGNYFGRACGDTAWYGDLSQLPIKRYLDLEVRLESGGVSSPVLQSLEIEYASNTAPTAMADAYSTAEDTTLTVSAPGVLAGDADPDGDELVAELVTDVGHGALTLSADGSFTYAPDRDWHGIDQFTYTANDAGTASGPATVTITVEPTADETALTATSSSKTLSTYGESYAFTGTLADAGGVPLADKRVVLQTASSSAATFVDSSRVATTSPTGQFSFTVTPTSKTYYRVRYAGEPGEWAESVTTSCYATPRHYVSDPRAPKTMSRTKSYTVYGYLKPKHASGSKPVALKCYKRNRAGDYKYHHTVYAKVVDYSSYSKYTAKVKLPHSGRWRVRAYAAADSQHANDYSGYDYITVK